MKPHWALLMTTIAASPLQAVNFQARMLHDNTMINYPAFKFAFQEETVDWAFGGEGPNRTDLHRKWVADFNGDGHDDLLSAGGSRPCSLFGCIPIPNSPPPFSPQMMLFQDGDLVAHDMGRYEPGSAWAVGDLDGDEDIDLLGYGRILVNDGSARFEQVLEYPPNFLGGRLTIADINQDGRMDFLDSVSFYLQQPGDFSFQKIPNTAANGEYYQVLDLNGDDAPDLVVHLESTLEVWLNDGGGAFTSVQQLPYESPVRLTRALDFTGDGVQDVIQIQGPGRERLAAWRSEGGRLVPAELDFSQIDAFRALAEFGRIRISDVQPIERRADGIADLVVSASFEPAECGFCQILLFVYEVNADGTFSHRQTLASPGSNEIEYPSINIPVVMDLNGDGLDDLVLSSSYPVSWLSTADGGFVLGTYSSLQHSQDVALADVNGDGYLDVLHAARFDTNRCLTDFSSIDPSNFLSATALAHGHIWLSDGAGGFDPVVGTDQPDEIHFDEPAVKIQAADFDGNGAIDTFFTTAEPTDDGSDPVLRSTYYHGGNDRTASTPLPLAASQMDLADLDNDGQLEMVLTGTDPGVLYVVERGQDQSLEVTQDHVNSQARFGGDARFAIRDMDQDGFKDLVWYNNVMFNNGSGNFWIWESVGHYGDARMVADFDGDALPDLFYVYPPTLFRNLGNRAFEEVPVDPRLTAAFEMFGTPFTDPDKPRPPARLAFGDFNGDGRTDFAGFVDSDFYGSSNPARSEVWVYLNEPGDTLDFRLAFQSEVSGPVSSLVAGDLDNDGIDELVSAGGSYLKILSLAPTVVRPGLYYDAYYRGEGVSLEPLAIDGHYFHVQYAYDEAGQPEWFAMTQRFLGTDSTFTLLPADEGDRVRYRYDFETGTASVDPEAPAEEFLNIRGWQGEGRVARSWRALQEGIFQLQLKELIPDWTTGPDFAGLWWAGPEDSGWGVSLSFVDRGAQVEIVAILYYYDAQGRPRWAIGQAPDFRAGQPLTVPMIEVTRDSGRVAATFTTAPAGTLELTLLEPSGDLAVAGRATVDVTYQGEAGGRWLREDIALALFSVPRDQP